MAVKTGVIYLNHKGILPTIACFLIGYIFANMFLTVYDLASSAILQCFLIDEETSGGTGKNRPPELEDFIISNISAL